MPDLAQSLGNYDLGYLLIVADSWGLAFSAQDFQLGLNRLVPLLLDESRLSEMERSLPVEAQAALDDLLENDGRITWAIFTRRYGKGQGDGFWPQGPGPALPGAGFDSGNLVLPGFDRAGIF